MHVDAPGRAGTAAGWCGDMGDLRVSLPEDRRVSLLDTSAEWARRSPNCVRASRCLSTGYLDSVPERYVVPRC